MPRTKTLIEVIDGFNLVHNNSYDYSKSLYVSAKTKLVIICSKHGEFSQTPNNHLRGSGCPHCGYIRSGNSQTNVARKKFFMESNIIHDNKYDYSKSEYTTSDNKLIIICPEHGEFSQTPSNHRCGKGCPTCGNLSSSNLKIKSNRNSFVAKAKSIHGDRYDYSNSDYVSGKSKLVIICHTHGEFKQSPTHHIRGHGCPKCAYDNSFPGYSNFYFNENPHKKDTSAIFYVVRISNGTESFIKIGITTKSILHRTYEIKSKGYSIDVMHQFQLTLYKAYQLEQHVLNELKHAKYKPSIKFGGHTECVLESVEVTRLINDLLTEIV